MKPKRKRLPGVRAWAWRIGSQLVGKADVDRLSIEEFLSETDTRKLVRVRIVDEKELRKLEDDNERLAELIRNCDQRFCRSFYGKYTPRMAENTEQIIRGET